jgi:ribose transport system permease protein
MSSAHPNTRLLKRWRPAGSASDVARRLGAKPIVWQLLAVVLLFAVFTYTGTNFWSRANWLNTSVFATTILLLALGQLLVVITAGIDLSVGAMLGVASTITGLFLARTIGDSANELDLVGAVLLGILGAGAMGLTNGLVITRLGVSPFIATLGTLGVGTGIILLLTNGQSVVVPDVIAPLGSQVYLSWLPIQVLIAAALCVGVHYLLRYTRFGLHTYAIGGELEASERMGINVRRHVTIIYTLCGVLCGVAGVLTVAQFGVASPNAGGERALLNAIAATVIGGASLFGGRGNVSGTVLGAVIVGSMVTGLVLMGVTPYWQTIVIGVVIVLAVYVQRLGELGGARLSAAQAPAPRQPVQAQTRHANEEREERET